MSGSRGGGHGDFFGSHRSETDLNKPHYSRKENAPMARKKGRKKGRKAGRKHKR